MTFHSIVMIEELKKGRNNMKKIRVEVCAGSVEDCIAAEQGGADQIELNSAVHLGGLTPSVGLARLAKKNTSLPIYAMLRPRAAGFHYNETEMNTLRIDAKALIDEKVDGLVFGFLNSDSSFNKELNKEFVDLCHDAKIDAVIHRSFDRAEDPYEAIETLIEIGADRILTSGQAAKAIDGLDLLKDLQEKYGDQIELVVGSGVNKDNIKEILEKTNVNQVHASFKAWSKDPTTDSNGVSYSYSDLGDYEVSSLKKIRAFISTLEND